MIGWRVHQQGFAGATGELDRAPARSTIFDPAQSALGIYFLKRDNFLMQPKETHHR